MNARRTVAAIAALLLVGAAVLVLPTPTGRAAGELQMYMTGLDWPAALAFAPDGRIFFAEMFTGRIRIINNGTLSPAPLYTVPGTWTNGEGGLVGLALDPLFPVDPWVYAYQTFDDSGNGTVYNRIVRIRVDGDTGRFHEVLLAGIPAAVEHNGGAIAFGPDGKLYAPTGEAGIADYAQDLLSLGGKVLRLNPDGSVPADNPFYGNASANPYVYTYGHRNMFGLAFHPVTGRAFITENGPECNDEVNILESGRNFGWGPNETCSTPPDPPNNTNQDGPDPVLPITWWTPPTGPTNALIYRGGSFPSWREDLIFGEWHTGDVRRLDLEPPNYDTVVSEDVIATVPDGVVDVEEGPDGAIWFTTQNTIYRFYNPNAQPPVAAFTASPNPTSPGTPVSFDASASYDPDGTIVSYGWDFGDAATGSGVTTTHAYALPGTYNATLTVVDNASFSANASRSIVVQSGGQPPVASFTAAPNPVDPGTPVTFNASASVDPDGTIVSYAWEFGDSAVGAGEVVAHAYSAAGTYAVVLTVVDDESRSGTASGHVIVNAPPRARIAYSPTVIHIGTVVTFDGSASVDPDGAIVSYNWDFGDGSTGTGRTALHTYAAKGTFTVALTVTDALGVAGRMTSSLEVRNRPPRITSSVPELGPVSVDAGTVRTFDVTAMDPDGDALVYTWRVGGAVAGGAEAFAFSEAAPGAYAVNVTVSDGSSTDWRSWTVTVSRAEGGPSAATYGVAAAVVLLAAVGATVLVWWVRRRRERGEAPPPPPPEGTGPSG